MNASFRAQILTTIALETVKTSVNYHVPLTSQSNESNISPKRQPLRHGRLFEMCAQQINEHLRSVRMWSSNAITTASPLIVCALIGPAAVFTSEPPNLEDGRGRITTLRSLEWQILKLVLSVFAERWEIGQYMHGLSFSKFCT